MLSSNEVYPAIEFSRSSAAVSAATASAIGFSLVVAVASGVTAEVCILCCF